MDAIVVQAVADVPDPANRGADNPNKWLITVADKSPLSGLFAWGDTIQSARLGLASLVRDQLKALPDVDHTAITTVTVLITTRKSFAIADLPEAPT